MAIVPLALILLIMPLNPIFDAVSQPAGAKPLKSILVFSKTGGFRHGSIEPGKTSFQKLGKKHGFKVTTTEDAGEFTEANLRQHQVIVFLNTTGDILDAGQQAAFEGYLRSGGGYVGIHAASDTEYDWPFYGKVVGAYFAGHPAVQPAKIRIEDPSHPATSFLPKIWERTDEWYNFREFPKHVKVLAWLDTDSYQGSSMPGKHPAIWCHDIDLGRALYTVGGHTDATFDEPLFLQHLTGALYWAAGHDDWKPSQSETKPEKKSPTPEKKEKSGA